MFRVLPFYLAAVTALAADSLIQVDQRKLVSRADLTFDTPESRPEEGMPVGNGRTGSLVWTSPSSLNFQINRVDAHAMDSTTVSFPRADSDYGSVCGYVDINVVDAGDDVFTGKEFRQHLSLYDALMTAQGKGLTARVLGWSNGDVLAIEIDDQRDQPAAINIDLRMLRYQVQFEKGRNFQLRQEHAAMFRTAEHTATSILGIHENRITLTQQYREKAFYNSTGIAIGVTGRKSRARYLNDSTVQLSAAPGKGKFTIFIASAVSASEDAAQLALAQLKSAEQKTFEILRTETADWWHNFWDRGFVALHSSSGQADFIESNYTYFLYLMGSSSRGTFPPRFGGMLWFTDGGMSRWGSQYWFANTYAYYSNLMPANRLELMDPMFRLYSAMYDAAAAAARQQWGTEGIWIPETTFFNGPEKLPNDIATELQDLMLVRKPWDQRSAHFDWYAAMKNRHNSRWNFRADGDWEHGYYVFKSKTSSSSGAFGHTSHILGVAARLGDLAWQRYQFTGDTAWLRDRAYPLIKGAAEFYRNFPNLQKGEDGIYHLSHTNSGESSWNSKDAAYEVAVMHMIFPLAVHASEVLGIDNDLRPRWKEINEHLPSPPSAQSGAVGSQGGGDRPYGAFVYNGPGAIEPIGPEPELKARFLGFTRLGSFIDTPGIGGAKIFRNRLRLREGPGAIDAEHIAGLSSGIHSTMLSSKPSSLTNEEPINLFVRWPKDWDAAFRLRARGGFVISSIQQNGTVPLVEIQSEQGGSCKLANPWGKAGVTLYRDGKKAEALTGDVLTFPSKTGETIVIAPQGSTPKAIKVL